MPRAFVFWFLGVSLALAGAGGARAEIPVRGFLVSGGEPVAGAAVRLAAAPSPELRFEMLFSHVEPAELVRTRSESDGYFELAAPETGFYQLQVEAEGFLGTDRWVAALGAAPDPLQVELIRARPVRLTILGPEGRPVAGARVRLGFEKDGAGRYPTWPLFRSTAADGSVLLHAPRGQDAVALVAAPGFVAVVAALPAASEKVETRLARGALLAVEVVDPQGRFLPGVVIFLPDSLQEIGRTGQGGRALVRIGAEQRLLAFTDAEGRYAVAAVPPAKIPAPEPAAVAAAGAPAAEPVLRVVLEERPPLEGRVFELPDRVPLAGAWVSLWGMPPFFTRTDRGGYFRLPRVPGRRLVQAAKEGYCPVMADSGAVPVELGIALAPAAKVFGRVTGAAGEPIAGVRVTANLEGYQRALRSGGRSWTLTDRDGRYAIADLPAGAAAEVAATYRQLTAKVTIEPVAAGESVRADLRLPRQETWRCRVLGPEEKPIPGAEIFVAAPGLDVERLPALDFASPERGGQARRLGLTDAEGRFTTRELPAGDYAIGARAPGFAGVWRPGVAILAAAADPDEQDGEAAGAAPADETFVLQPLARAFGKVLDAVGDVGLPEATLHPGDSPGPDSPPLATSGDGGEFSLAAAPAGRTFQLIAGKEGYVSARLAGLVRDDGTQPAPLEVRLVRAGLVYGQVLGEGRPLDSALLRIEPLDLPPRQEDLLWQRQTRSDAEGRYTFGRLWPGRYRLTAERSGFQAWRSEVFEVSAGERKQLDAELLEAAVVFGKVLLPSGAPVADAWVSLGENSVSPPSSRARLPTDVLGQYRIDSAKPGAGWLLASSRRYREQGRAVDVGPGINEIDFVLETGSLEIAGRVVDGAGEPIAGVRVQLQGESIFREARTGLDGEVRFTELDAGKYHLEPSARGYLGETVELELESSLEDQVWKLRAARSRISGSVFGLDPAALAAVRVVVRPAGAGGAAAVASHGAGPPPGVAVDPGGRFSAGGLVAGAWLLVASLPGPSRVVVQRVEIAEGDEEQEQDLDFGRLAGPWIGHLRVAGQAPAGFSFLLAHGELGPLLSGTESGERLELHAEPGAYRLEIWSEGVPSKELEIEIGAPLEQEVELAPPR